MHIKVRYTFFFLINWVKQKGREKEKKWRKDKKGREGKGKEGNTPSYLWFPGLKRREATTTKKSFSVASDTPFPWIFLLRFPWYHPLLVCMCPSLPIWSHRYLFILHSLNTNIFKIPPLTAFLPHHLPKWSHSFLWFQQRKTHILLFPAQIFLMKF